MTDHKALPGTASDWIDRFSAMQVFKEYGNIQECTFQHVYLDLAGMIQVYFGSFTIMY